MTFRKLSEYFAQLEATTLRNKMTQILADLFKNAKANEIGKLCYLLQGRVAPLFTAIEFGIADRMMIRAIAGGLRIDQKQVTREFKKEGDLGQAVEKLKVSRLSGIPQAAGQSQKSESKGKNLNIIDVYDVLYKVATSGGNGSQEIKIQLLGDLLNKVDPLSARYIVRITLAKLRLGFSAMTMLDSLSWMLSGSKVLRPKIEKAYNVRPDLGFISETIKKQACLPAQAGLRRQGVSGLDHIVPCVGTPILMARAERMKSGADILEKIGKCAIEPKYDGFRLQIHLNREGVNLYSRNLENVTAMYPDIVAGARAQIKAKQAIFEGEAIGINLKTGEYLPFQETVQRKRKYDIEIKAKEIPLKLFAFDCLLVDNEIFIHKSYLERRKKLEQIIGKGTTIYIAQEEIVDSEKRLEELFADAVTRGLEGVMAKKLEGDYRAGARDFAWIKYKRSYAGKLADTIDTVVLGYDLGQGKRTGFGIGDFLIGIYDEKKDRFVTLAKVGTGLTDEEWRELKVKSQKLKVKKKPGNYDVDKMMECDVWMSPEIVVEIKADEITRSPVHTAGRVMKPSKSGAAWEIKEAGYALRFPRLERFRVDKDPQSATTLSEIGKMYKQQ